MQALLHPRSQTKLKYYLQKPAHGLILLGREGSGKFYLAKQLAKELNAEHLTIEAEEGASSITITQIRDLYGFTRTGANLIVIIKDAHMLGVEAQNAFLKLLEEPPKNTRFILTSYHAQALLPTIRSRAQLIEVLPLPKKHLLAASSNYELSELQKQSLLHTSEQLAGQYFNLLQDIEAYENHQITINQAKQFYAASAYERHLMCVDAKYDKTWAKELLHFLSIIIESLLRRPELTELTKNKLIAQADLLQLTADNILKVNGNPKIHLAKLCEQL